MLSTWMLHLAEGIDVIAAVVIGIASLRAAATAARLFLQRAASNSDKEEVRLKLGLWLSLALELVLGADILRTTIAPSWEEIGKLAAIVVLRTVLNYFLQTEIGRAASRKTVANANPSNH